MRKPAAGLTWISCLWRDDGAPSPCWFAVALATVPADASSLVTATEIWAGARSEVKHHKHVFNLGFEVTTGVKTLGEGPHEGRSTNERPPIVGGFFSSMN